MTEDEKYKLQPAYLLGAIEALQNVVEQIVMQLPDSAMKAIDEDAARWARELSIEAKQRNRDDLRDMATAAYDIWESLSQAIDVRMDEYAEGDRKRTIQPFSG